MGSTNLFGKNPRLLKLLTLFLACLALDQGSKGLISGPILNFGFFLGSFSFTSPFYRIFCTIALLSITMLVLILVQFLTAKILPSLGDAIAVLEAGLVGNGIDKIRFGAVRDFISVPFFKPTLVINFADLCLWFSMVAILILIWKDPKKIWPKENLRAQLFVYPRSQGKMVALLMTITALVSFGNELLFLAYLRSNGVLFSYKEISICFLLFTALLLGVVFVFGVLWSNRVYSPFKALGRYLSNGDASQEKPFKPFKLRDSDENECFNEIVMLLEQSEHNRRQ